MADTQQSVLPWLYFGCGTGIGHHLFGQDSQRWHSYRDQDRYLENLAQLDGMLAPQDAKMLLKSDCPASLTRLGGWGYSALSWWDRSVDTRPGSNSIIFAPDMTIKATEIEALGRKRFPWVFARLKVQLSLVV